EQRGPDPGARGHRSGQPGARDRSSLPVMVGPARDALREIALRAVRVPRPEACLVERVVEDVALGAAPAQLDDPPAQRLDPLDRLPVLPRHEGVATPDVRTEHLAGGPCAVAPGSLPEHSEVAIGGW